MEHLPNCITAVEIKHHLVAHEVTKLDYDRDALTMMAHDDAIEAIADKGYDKG
jgi:hypothetical protein